MPLVYLALDIGKTNVRLALYTEDLRQIGLWRLRVADAASVQELLSVQLAELCTRHDITRAGVSTFGPLDTDPQSKSFGAIHNSSDSMWSGVNLPLLVAKLTHRPVRFDYDVNSGALAEHTCGAARGLGRFAYLSVGTGIGAAFFRDGIDPGFSPQFGHISITREPGDLFNSVCPFHKDCLQGLASGRALARRYQRPAEELEVDHEAWDLQARYLARACVNIVYSFCPERILLGSSGALAPGLLRAVNAHLFQQLNGFLDPVTAAQYAAVPPVVLAKLTPDSSLVGAAVLARDGLGLLYTR